MEAVFRHHVTVGFGDCDPARIAFYPNYFRWFDAAYNAYLFQYFGSFEEALSQINTIGTGAMEVGARFHSPVVPGDVLELHVTATRAGGKIWKFHGEARVDGQLAASHNEIGRLLSEHGMFGIIVLLILIIKLLIFIYYHTIIAFI